MNILSPKWLHRLVHDRARALKLDEHYDFTQWGEDRAPRGDQFERGIHAFLLIEEKAAVGVTGFSYRKWTNYPAGWHMNFVWIAEPYRRQGILLKRWPGYLKTYGTFTVEFPLSGAMEAFLLKVGHSPIDKSKIVKDGQQK